MRTHQGVHGSADKQRTRGKLIEEFLLDDGPFLSLGARVPPTRMHKQAAKLRTVSIIDTLSELTPGELDQEDLYGTFHSFYPEPHSPHLLLHCRNNLPTFHTPNSRRIPGCEKLIRNSRLDDANRKVLRKYETLSALRPNNRPPVQQQHRGGAIGSLPYNVAAAYGRDPSVNLRQTSSPDCPYLSDTGLPCRRSAIKPLQRNLVSMSSTPQHNLVTPSAGQRSRWQSTAMRSAAQESTRHCFSDSEIDATELLNVHNLGPVQGVVSKLKYKSNDCLDVDSVGPSAPRTSKDRKVESWICSLGEPCSLPSSTQEAGKCSASLPSKYCRQSRMPEWIRLIFKIAKQGNLEMLKAGMKDMDSALVRNLSDCNGNNLWHVCSSRNYLACVQWLSNKFGHDALKDENKGALTPCILAVKNGSLSVVQWLLEHTSCQVFSPADGSRSLLHYAAKYGQGSVLSWLVEYMTKLGMDLNAKDAEGNTSLHLAAKYGHIQCVKDLSLHGGDLMSRNELGLRPYDLAVFSQQSSCAEYLISVETCLALATDHYLLEGDAQRYRMENSDAKRNFKDLLQLMKSSLRHQREMLEACKRIQSHWQQEHETAISQECGESPEESSPSWQGALPGEEFERWFSSLVLKDESLCQMIEDKWKRQSRKAARQTSPKKEPLDILRSQFVQTQVKANSLTPLPDVSILSSSESDCSEESGEESSQSPQKSSVQFPDISSHAKNLTSPDSVPPFSKNVKLSRAAKVSAVHGRKKSRISEAQPILRPWSMHGPTHADMDLRDLFERNPELKQEGQTCSVLEVLEPSSSENEELAQLEKQYAGSVKASKSSNSLESESSCSSGSKSKARSTQDISLLPKGGQVDLSCCIIPPGKVPVSAEPPKPIVKSSHIAKLKERSKDNVKQSEGKGAADSAARSNKSSPSTSTSSDSKSLDSERIEADAITSHPGSSGDGIESSNSESSPELTGTGQSSVLKKKGFLLKFSLKNRWSSKQKQRNTKKCSDTISDDIKESKMDTISIADTPLSSQLDTISDNLDVGLSEETVVVEIHNVNLQQTKKVERFLPPPPPPPPTTRRDPPPMPPTNPKEYGVSVGDPLDCSSSLLPDILSSMTLEETPTEHSSQTEQSGQSSNDQFCSSSDVSRLYGSTVKSDSRPPSSASRIDSTLRPEDAFKSIGFPLRKTSSASTELLMTPDSSTAGRQSPAPSEVSKTESALSPPSDVSKTESQRHASHLGKIEETSVMTKKTVEATILDIGMGLEAAEGQCMEVAAYIQADIQSTQNFIQSKVSTKKESSNKPWYEVSDDEDILSPGRSLGTQSNSEDEVQELVR